MLAHVQVEAQVGRLQFVVHRGAEVTGLVKRDPRSADVFDFLVVERALVVDGRDGLQRVDEQVVQGDVAVLPARSDSGRHPDQA